MALVQARTINAGGSPLSLAFSSPVALGHFLVAFVSAGEFPSGSISITGVSDDVNGAWTAVSGHSWLDATGTLDSMAGEFWYLDVASAAGTTTVTATFSIGTTLDSTAIAIAEFSGVVLPPVLDAHSETDDASSTSHSGTPVITSTDCLVLGAFSDAGGFADAYSVGSGWTQVTRVDSNAFDQILLEQQSGAAGTYTATATTSASHEVGIFTAAFQEAAAPPPPPPPVLFLPPGITRPGHGPLPRRA